MRVETLPVYPGSAYVFKHLEYSETVGIPASDDLLYETIKPSRSHMGTNVWPLIKL